MIDLGFLKNENTIVYILFFSLILRLIALVFLPDQNFPDAMSYEDHGIWLFKEGIFPADVYMPLYPIWTYITGGGITLRVADIVLSVMTVWLVWKISYTLFNSSKLASLSALAAAIWPHFIFYSVSGLTETAYTFIICFSFYLLYRSSYKLAIILLVTSILIRPTLEPFIPILLFSFMFFIHRLPGKIIVKNLCFFGLVYLCIMSPWWIFQYEKYDDFVRLNLGAGHILYSGNNIHNKTGGGIGGGVDVDFSDFRYMKDMPIERNRAMKEEAINFIKNNPGSFVNLMGKKFVRFWRLWPYADEYNKPHFIIISLLSYGLMLFAFIHFLLFFVIKNWRVHVPIILFIMFLTLVHIITIGSIRYRFPIEPFIIIYGCYSISRFLEKYSGIFWKNYR